MNFVRNKRRENLFWSNVILIFCVLFPLRMVEYSLDLQNINFSAIRTVRVLRPLKAINRVPSEYTLLFDTCDHRSANPGRGKRARMHRVWDFSVLMPGTENTLICQLQTLAYQTHSGACAVQLCVWHADRPEQKSWNESNRI